jgi:hypothetical protein
MADRQVSIEESVRTAKMAQCADDANELARADAMAEMGKAPIDLVSADEDSQGQGTKRGRSCGEAPCDEEAPELKSGAGEHCPLFDDPLDDTTAQPKKRARGTRGLKVNPKAKAHAKGSAKASAGAAAAKGELKVIESEV